MIQYEQANFYLREGYTNTTTIENTQAVGFLQINDKHI